MARKMSRTSRMMHSVPEGSLQNTEMAHLDDNNRKINGPKTASGIIYILP
jgi:hypothetical protein